MQHSLMTDRRVLLIGGVVFEGQYKISESGFDEDSVEAPLTGNTALLATGQMKQKAITVTYLNRRNSPESRLVESWHESGDERDVQLFYTDKSGDIQNAWKCVTYFDCETGGIVDPEADKGSPKASEQQFMIYPKRRQVQFF